METKKKGEKEKPFFDKNFFTSKNPYNWYGFILLVIGAIYGGALGGAIGGIAGFKIIKIGNNKNYTRKRKLTAVFLLTLGGLVAYSALVAVISLALYPLA